MYPIFLPSSCWPLLINSSKELARTAFLFVLSTIQELKTGIFYILLSGADPRKNLTGLLESERRIYESPETCFPAKVFRFSLSKMTLPAILSHLENLTDFRKTVETGLIMTKKSLAYLKNLCAKCLWRTSGIVESVDHWPHITNPQGLAPGFDLHEQKICFSPHPQARIVWQSQQMPRGCPPGRSHWLMH